MKVIVYPDRSGDFRWKLKAENGEILADSGEGYRHRGYAISKAESLFPNAELVIEEEALPSVGEQA